MHQSKDYIKTKLGLWRAQKCIPLVGAISALTCACPQTTPTHVRQYGAENGILGKSGATFRHSAVFALNKGLYIKRKLGLWRAQKCVLFVGAISALTCASPQTTSSHVWQYRIENGILGKSVATFRLGALFAPKQGLHQKEARAMESLKMCFSHRCNKRTYLSRFVNYPDTCKAVQG